MSRPDITFITGHFIRRCSHRIDKVFEGYSTLQYMSSGQVSLRVGEADYALNGRTFWSAYPGPRIAFHPAEPSKWWVHRYVALRGPLVNRWADDGLFPIQPQQPPGDDDYADRFDEVLALSASQRRWDHVRAAHALESILIDLAEARDIAPEPPAWIRSVSDQLARMANQDVDYEALSERLGMSVRTLRRNFNRKQGTSPHQFLIGERVRTAQEMLLKSDIPLKEIATRLGYSDVFYFGRQFKKSPALLRRDFAPAARDERRKCDVEYPRSHIEMLIETRCFFASAMRKTPKSQAPGRAVVQILPEKQTKKNGGVLKVSDLWIFLRHRLTGRS